jgi:hypothetical protein
MPTQRPTLSELVAVVRDSLASLPEPPGFELRVVRHALEIVAREIAQAAAAEQIEHAALRGVLGHDGEPEALSHELCERLARGLLAPNDPLFLERMRACVRARLAIDNPRFEGTSDDDQD